MHNVLGRPFRAIAGALLAAAVIVGPPATPAHASTTPSQPTDVAVTVGNRFLSATWRLPVVGVDVPVGAYSVVAVDTTTGKKTWTNVSPDVRQASVNGLTNGRDYDLYVVPWGFAGMGAPAILHHQIPSPYVPRATAPGRVYLQNVRSGPDTGSVRTLYISWGPLFDDHGAPVLAYGVAVVQNGVVLSWTHGDQYDRARTIPNIPAGVATTVYIVPVNAFGYTQESAPMTLNADTSHATILINRTYDTIVTVTDINSNNWTLPDEVSVEPWVLETSFTQGDSASVRRVGDSTCGSTGSGDYFLGGHDYKLLVGFIGYPVGVTPPHCADGLQIPVLFVMDITTGTFATISS